MNRIVHAQLRSAEFRQAGTGHRIVVSACESREAADSHLPQFLNAADECDGSLREAVARA